MKLDVSPTRMELLKLKKKLLIARRGHKLLKDKLDELIRIIMGLLREIGELRSKSGKLFFEANLVYEGAAGISFPLAADSSMRSFEGEVSVPCHLKQMLNLKVPDTAGFERTESELSYGFSHTTSLLDHSVKLHGELLNILVILSAGERQIEMIAAEIEKTRRRVNALEYILIPGIEDTIRYISMKLEENERSSQIQLMRIKDVVRAPVAHSSAYPGVSRYTF